MLCSSILLHFLWISPTLFSSVTFHDLAISDMCKCLPAVAGKQNKLQFCCYLCRLWFKQNGTQPRWAGHVDRMKGSQLLIAQQLTRSFKLDAWIIVRLITDTRKRRGWHVSDQSRSTWKHTDTDIDNNNSKNRLRPFQTVGQNIESRLLLNKNSSGDEIANMNFYALRPEATRIRWNNAK